MAHIAIDDAIDAFDGELEFNEAVCSSTECSTHHSPISGVKAPFLTGASSTLAVHKSTMRSADSLEFGGTQSSVALHRDPLLICHIWETSSYWKSYLHQ
ncbi:hypothetical protein NL676_035124 [Syzygium grande]|nr:hypothetical protein NL676_035124 [Syzygium grande]